MIAEPQVESAMMRQSTYSLARSPLLAHSFIH
jgi:hypothetical protein